MIGAIIGDIVGSIYEFDNIKTKTFPFFSKEKEFTDDSILTLATAEWMLRGGNPADYYLTELSQVQKLMVIRKLPLPLVVQEVNGQ